MSSRPTLWARSSRRQTSALSRPCAAVGAYPRFPLLLLASPSRSRLDRSKSRSWRLQGTLEPSLAPAQAPADAFVGGRISRSRSRCRPSFQWCRSALLSANAGAKLIPAGLGERGRAPVTRSTIGEWEVAPSLVSQSGLVKSFSRHRAASSRASRLNER